MPTHEIARLKLAQAPEGRRHLFSRMTVMEKTCRWARPPGESRRLRADLEAC